MRRSPGSRSAIVLCVALSACEPPVPILAKLSAPVLTAQRRMGGPLLAVLTYDTKRTPCGEVNFLRATLDGLAMQGSAGKRVVNKMDGTETCEFPNFSLMPTSGTSTRELLLTDDVTAVIMDVSTLNVGTASPEFPPATLRPGYLLRWNAQPPAAGTSSYNVIFTPEGGSPVTWLDGVNLPSSFSVTVPAVTAAASGSVAATWLVNAAVTQCAGVESCTATIQGAASFPAVVAP